MNVFINLNVYRLSKLIIQSIPFSLYVSVPGYLLYSQRVKAAT